MKEFERGQKIKVYLGGDLEVITKLGSGGQGIVYKVKYNNKEYALKWYFPNKIKDKEKFYKNIQRNINLKAPTEAFLWPLAITEEYEGSFGYLMDLRPSEYKDFSQFLRAKEKFSSIGAVINAALTISNAFRELHRKGCSYQDLNDGNFFINPKTGDVLICDNDNVAEYGEALGIVGKSRYMAPEVVVGKKLPDVHTDKFSLAVVLYLMLFLNHPLEGQKTICPCLTEELEKKFYGIEPVFVWDSKDNSNRPVRGVHTNEIKLWGLYPKFIRELFEKSFSKEYMIGQDTEHRITEKEWQDAFTKLRDSLIICSCRSETFLNTSEATTECISCGKEIQKPSILKVKKYLVPIQVAKKLYNCHILADSDDFKEVKAEIITGKNDPTIVGLKNNSDNTWIGILPNGQTKSFGKGEVVKLGKGLKINFGNNNICEII